MSKNRPLPIPESLDEYALALAEIIVKKSWVPHPKVVRALGRAVFPTVRAKKDHPRLSEIRQGKNVLGMYDDNTTPRWALLWAHGIRATGHPSGWTFAHVWENADDIEAYTHLANLVMVPECLASLTDKSGPLTTFLRWHAWTAYQWKPSSENEPAKPECYDELKWRYLDKSENPREIIKQRLTELGNERVLILRPIMEHLGMI